MTVHQLRYSKEEFARRDNVLYESQVRPQVEQEIMAKLWRLTLKLELLRLPMI
jgi:hypothetical protein